jgi:hypothetical protein
MNDDSEVIGDSKVIQFRGTRGAEPFRRLPTAGPSAAFSNRVKHAVAHACRTDIAAVEIPLGNLLLSVADSESDLVGNPCEKLDNSQIARALDQVRAIPKRADRDCTAVLKYIQRLSEPQRTIVTLRWSEGLTYRDIAKRVDMDPRSVCVILSQHMGAMSDIYSAAPAH